MQRVIYYDVAFSAFKYYFQMGEITIRLCTTKLVHGIVECPSTSDLYLHIPTKSDAIKIEAHVKQVYDLSGCLEFE